MPTIDIRKIVNTKYRIRIRPSKLPYFSITFSSLKECENWISEHEQKYIENPQIYQQWIKANRKSIKENGIFHNHIPLENFMHHKVQT